MLNLSFFAEIYLYTFEILPKGYYLCSVNLLTKAMDEKEKYYLSSLIMTRMEAKSNIEYYRGLSEITGRSYEIEINENLDLINLINRIESELRKK